MQEQITEMSVQSGILKESVDVARAAAIAAEKSAGAAQQNVELIINKERARLRIESPTKLNLSVDQPIVINYRVFYDGFTPAFSVQSEINAIVSESKDSPVNDYLRARVNGLPAVVSAKDIQSGYMAHVVRMGPNLALNVDGTTLHKVLQQEWFIHFWGWIKYEDFFERPRETTFRYRWIQ